MPISKEENKVHKDIIKSQKEISKKINNIAKEIKKHHKKHGPPIGRGFLDDMKNLGNSIKSGFENTIEHPIEDLGNTIKTGFQDNIVNPIQQKIIDPVQAQINSLPQKTQDIINKLPQSMKDSPQFQQAIDYITKKKGGLASSLLHNGLPSLTSALGGAAGTVLAPELGMFGGIAGSTAGGYAGKELADYIGDKTGTGLRKKRKSKKYYSSSEESSDDERPTDSALGQLLKAHRRKEEKELKKGELDIARHLHEEMMALRHGQPLKRIHTHPVGHGVRKRGRPKGSGLKDGTENKKPVVPINYVGCGFKKGSKEAKEHMARIRAMKGTGTGPLHYGSAWSAHNAQLYGNGGKGLYP